MKSFRNFLRRIDIFGVPFNFRYKTKDKYSTPCGGFLFLLFVVLALTFGIYYLIPFINRKNLSIIYYTMNIPETEVIKLKDSQAAFEIGLNCENKTAQDPYEIFNLEIKYVLYTKDMDGKYDKKKTPLVTHLCTYNDFYNNYDTSFDYLGMKNYLCLDNNDHKIEGIYSNQLFSYYEFSLTSKGHTSYAEKYLKVNDCKLQMFYTDITIDLNNYKEPIKPFLNSFFVQLNPTLYIKRNVFFMNQYLYDDDELITVFDDEQKPKQTKTLFSRYEEYSLYLGLDRENNKPLISVEDYAKMYLRADTKKTEIKRTYQKLTEFYADASSLLIALYDFISVTLSIISNFYAEQAVIRKLFLFKEMDNKYFHFSKKSEKIQELVSLTNEVINIDLPESTRKRLMRSKSFLYTRNNYKNSRNFSIISMKNTETIDKEDHENKIRDEIKNNLLKQKTIKFSFNIFEVIISLLFPYCLRGNLKLKIDVSEKANNLLNQKLNVILYVRNMILLDILNHTIIDDKKRDILNFLSRPIIASNKNKYEKQDKFYENLFEYDFDKFYNCVYELSRKANKNDNEKRLINLSKQHLKELA